MKLCEYVVYGVMCGIHLSYRAWLLTFKASIRTERSTGFILCPYIVGPSKRRGNTTVFRKTNAHVSKLHEILRVKTRRFNIKGMVSITTVTHSHAIDREWIHKLITLPTIICS